MKKRRIGRSPRRGAIVVLAAVLLVVFLALAAFAIDVGYIALVRSELQNVADSAALAGAAELVNRDQLKNAYNTDSIRAVARENALAYASMNSAGGKPILVEPNNTNLPTGDLVVGFLSNPSDPASSMTTNTSALNAVRVVARRSASQNGSSPLFFARALGRETFDVTAEATAVIDTNITGFTAPQAGQKSKLLPFAMHVDQWLSLLSGNGNDVWSVNPSTGTVTSGSDGIRETQLYGNQKQGAGSFGTVNIGPQNNGAGDIRRQILEGPSASDFASHGGKIELNSQGKLLLSGDPGLTAGFRSQLEAIRGQPRAIPLYESISGSGGASTYTIVGFAGITITEVKLTGPTKRVMIQPEIVRDRTAISRNVTPVAPQFIYRPVRLAR